MKDTNLIVFAAVMCSLVATEGNAAITVFNDFENGKLPNNFNNGEVGVSTTGLGSNALIHKGNSPQEVRANIKTAVSDNTSPFAIAFDLGVDVDESQNGGYGFRTYMEDRDNGVFSLVWNSEVNGGNLALSLANNDFLDLGLDSTWNIDTNLADVESFTYNFLFEIFPEPAGNPGESTGEFRVTVERSDGVVSSSGKVDWRSNNNLSSQRFDEIVFFNSSSKTTVEIDNLAGGAVPEPSVLFFSLFGTLPFIFRRKRG